MPSPSSVYPPPSHRERPRHRVAPAPVVAVRPLPTDREHYAMLWGSTPAGRRRIELIELKRRAALVALIGSFILALLMLTGALA